MATTPTLESYPGRYYRQRAAEQVAWRPWTPLASASVDDTRPIFLTIGYADCRWCQQMGNESFNDPEIAALLNERFVPVCVDRERRPDLDKVYQNAFQLLNGSPGGWPLNLLLTADDRLAFFAAGYLAPEPRGPGTLPGFKELLLRLADFYRDQPEQVRQQNAQIAEALKAGPSRHGASGYTLRPAVLGQAVELMKQRFDASHGGFEGAPKHPQAPMLERLLRHYHYSRTAATEPELNDPDTRAGFIAKYTLEKIAASPLQATSTGGGFYRYANSADWSQPLPEQALVDNAALLALYAQLGQLSDSQTCREVAQNTARWLLNGPLAADDGGFYPLLSGLDNSEQPPQVDEQRRIASNGVAIGALAIAGRLLQQPTLITAAERTLTLLKSRCWSQDRSRLVNALSASDTESQTPLPAFLDDYVWLLHGLLELLQCRFHHDDLRFAMQLSEVLLEHYQEPSKKGGFYYTADDHEALIQRPRPIFDDSLPALNGVAAQLMIRLGHWHNSLRHLLAAERALKNAWPSLERNLPGCCGILLGLEEYFFPSETLLLRGSATALQAWRSEHGHAYTPRQLLLLIPDDDSDAEAPLPLPAALADCVSSGDGSLLGYRYRAGKCSPAFSESNEFSNLIS